MQLARRLGVGVCLLLAIAASVLWVRGRWAEDAFMLFAPGGRMQAVATGEGRIRLWLSNVDFGPECAWTAGHTRGSRGELQLLRQSFWTAATSGASTWPVAVHWAMKDAMALPGAWFICVGISWWIVVPLLWIPPLLAAHRRLRLWRWKRGGQCLCCGYDLRATPAGCPECGAGLRPEAEPKAGRTRWVCAGIGACVAIASIMVVCMRPGRPAAAGPGQAVLRMYDISAQVRMLMDVAKTHGAVDDAALWQRARKEIASAVEVTVDPYWPPLPGRLVSQATVPSRVEWFGDRVAILAAPGAHQAALQTLKGILEAKGQVVSVETRIVEVFSRQPDRSAAGELKRLDALLNEYGESAVLDGAEANVLLRRAAAIGRSAVTIAPRITLLGGTLAYVIVGNQQAYVRDYAVTAANRAFSPVVDVATGGVSMAVQPLPGAKGRPVRVDVNLRLAQLLRMDTVPYTAVPTTLPLLLDKPVMDIYRLNAMLAIPAGKTMLLRNLKRVPDDQAPVEQGEPVRNVLVLITPTILGDWPLALPPPAPPPLPATATGATTMPATK